MIHQIAQIAVLGAVHLADGLLLHRDALIGLDGDDGRHPDAASRLDRLAERRAVEIVIDDIGDVLLPDRLDRQSQLVADGLCRIPGIGGNDFFGMSERRFKLLFGEVAPRAPWRAQDHNLPRYSCRRP